MFRIVVTEETKDAPTETSEIVRYTQVVDELNLRAVMQAVNQKPRKPRTKKGANDAS